MAEDVLQEVGQAGQILGGEKAHYHEGHSKATGWCSGKG